MPWKCFVMEPTDKVERWLRRYSRERVHCPASEFPFHNATTRIEDGPLIVHGDDTFSTSPLDWPRDDLRWPTACPCGYQFSSEDNWQLSYDILYTGPNGEIYTTLDAPPGALWRLTWCEKIGNWRGADGQCWALKLPPGGPTDVWLIDGPSSDGGKWKRSGEPPLFTAVPSIKTSKYHGWLTNGELTDDIG